MVIYRPAVRIAIFVVVVIACGSPDREPPPAPAERPPVPAPTPRPPVRNPPLGPISTIRAADYIGPDACGECHPTQHAAWTTGLHRRMNQLAGPQSIIGNFATSVTYAGGVATFARDGASYTMTLAKNDTTTRYRVTRTIGVRALQEYVGVDMADANAIEVRLPFAWWPKAKGWFAQPYFDPWFAHEDDFDAYAPVKEPWAERCPWCHSTYPFEQRIARASARSVGHGMEQFFTSTAGTDRLAIEQQVTTGISCESCHLGGKAHAAGAPISFVPHGAEALPGAPVPTTFAQERADATIVNRVCAQCHSGPSPRLADGTALRNSSEALDLAASPCTTARCIDCHDPHTGGSDEKRAIAACTRCHAQLSDTASQIAHAGHASQATDAGHASQTATCLDCHMPKLVMGIDRVVRTHRISSPTNPAIVASGGLNACNLCHVDRSLQWTLDELRSHYEITLRARGGDRDQPMGERWLASKDAALRLVAADALARSSLARLALPSLKKQLADPVPHVRAWARFAVDRVPLR